MSLIIPCNLIFILLILSFNGILNESNEVVYLEFNSYYKDGAIVGDSFINNLNEKRLYSKIKIGEDNHDIMLFFTMSHPYLALTPIHLEIKDNIFNTKYNYKDSKSFKNISYPHEYFIESKEDIKAKETFQITFYNYKDNKQIDKSLDNMNFILGINGQYKQNPYLVNLGLELILNNLNKDKKENNLIYQLKSRNIIDNYYLSYLFDKGNNNDGQNLYNYEQLFNPTGKVIIGDIPNYFENIHANCSKYELLSTYSYRIVDSSESQLHWTIQFNEIYYTYRDRTYTDNSKIVNFDINEFLIQAPLSYSYNIKYVYFNTYLNDGVCHLYSDNGYETYYFDISKYFNISKLKSFPSLHFKNNELQYTFELTYEDLFVEKDGKLWFLITFPTINKISQWFFGSIFLRKYNLLFNYDSKTISFYNPNLPKKEKPTEKNTDESDSNNSNSNSLVIKICIGIIVVLVILSIGMGIYIYKICFKNKKNKNRLNEIDENFEYESHENNIKKDTENDSQPNLMGV